MLIDACLFYLEADLLALRMMLLRDVVDHFVVVSLARTHQGDPVDRHAVEEAFLIAGERAEVRATHHWVEPSNVLYRNNRIYERGPNERGGTHTIWFMNLEHQHRDGVRQAVTNVTSAADALVMCSDVDELPNPAVVKQILAAPPQAGRTFVLEQRFHSTALDLLHPHQPWLGTIVSRYSDLAPQIQRDMRGQVGQPGAMIFPIPDGGWHISWCGTDEERQRKLETFSHYEILRDSSWDAREGRRTGTHPNGEVLQHLSITDSYRLDWPAPLLTGEFVPPESWYSAHAWEES